MKHLFSLLLLSFSLNAMSQIRLDSIPEFPKDSAVWVYYPAGVGINYDVMIKSRYLKLMGDTQINGQRYGLMHESKDWDYVIGAEDSLRAFIRSSNDSVFVRYPSGVFNDGNEYLLYVFSPDTLSIETRLPTLDGDTIRYKFKKTKRTNFSYRSLDWVFDLYVKDTVLTPYTQCGNRALWLPNAGHAYEFFYHYFDYSLCEFVAPGHNPKGTLGSSYWGLGGLKYRKDGKEYCAGMDVCQYILSQEEREKERKHIKQIVYFNMQGKQLNAEYLPKNQVLIERVEYTSGAINYRKTVHLQDD